jgi:choline dehydrogenase-like flavoprotein
MEHPKVLAGAMLLSNDETDMTYYAFMPESRSGRTIPSMNWLVLSDEVAEKERIARYSVWPQPANEWCCWTPEGHQSLKTVRDHIFQGRIPAQLGSHISNIVEDSDLVSDRALYEVREVVGLENPRYYALISSTEQVPTRESRVTLTSMRDQLGQNRVRLHMQAGELDRQTVLRGTQVLADEVARAGLGRVRVLLDEEDSWPMATGRAHHMGTTRMTVDPRHGVVDANCRVHSTDNLFVAGASVFPTSGCGAPTLTVVALAIRLADHLARLMSA